MISSRPPARAHNQNVISTYRYLRAAMIALLFMLVLSPIYQWAFVPAEAGGRCLLGSISAYYFTPARTVFVGSLFALGACLIAYKGHSREEDVLLNFSGFMAFVVAIVPTAPDLGCGTNLYSQTVPEIEAAVRNNFTVLLAVTLVATIVLLILRRRASSQSDSKPARDPLVWIIWLVAVGVVVGEILLFLLRQGEFIAVSHGFAAVTMVAGVIAVMALSARKTEERFERRGDPASKPQVKGQATADAPAARTGRFFKARVARTQLNAAVRRYRDTYLGIAIALGVSLVGTVIVWYFTGLAQFIFWVEVIVVVLFAVYWIVQTVELRNLTEALTINTDEGDGQPEVTDAEDDSGG